LKLLVFDISGSMAHFRDIGSTSTQLTYMLPPRTTIIGLVAGILGLERDSYYEQFSDKNCRIAVSARTPLRKWVQSVNNLDTDTITNTTLRGMKTHPFPSTMELILPDPPNTRLAYRVYFTHREQEVTDEVERRIKNRRFKYPPSLGPANFLATLTFVRELEVVDEEVQGDKHAEVFTAVRNRLIEHILTLKAGQRIYSVEGVQADFSAERKVTRIENYTFECSKHSPNVPLAVSLKRTLGKAAFKDGSKHGIFL